MPERVIEMNETTNVIWDIKEVTKTGATGDPTKATIEKGEQMIEILVGIVTDGIEKMNKSGWTY